VSTGYTGESEDELEVVGEELPDILRPIEETAGGFRVRLQVASAFFPQIIGKGGQIKVSLEERRRGENHFIPQK
jgi:hypothetical protein